jgi:PadR family transcriptional regulator, regulatory protein AphA
VSLKHAILGLLSLQPQSGYDLRKVMDQSTSHFWPADQAQIYRTLALLATDGLVDVRDVAQSGKPDRREHRITAKGEQELDRWLASPVEYVPAREAFLLRLFFLGRLGVHPVLEVLEQRAREAENLLAVLRGLEDSLRQQLPPTLDLPLRLRLATLSNGVVHAQAELDWVRRLSHEISSAS